MYCQTSSSVQLLIGKTRMCSPLRIRPLYRLHSSGRWLRGSQPPSASRWLKIRSFARAFSSSRRPPPNSASNPCSAIASSKRDRLEPVARGIVAGLLLDPPGVDRGLDGGDDEPLAELRDPAIAEVQRLGEVVAGVDVDDREREAARPEGLLGEAQQDDGILAAAEQQRRALEDRGRLAEDVDRLGLEGCEVRWAGMLGPARRASRANENAIAPGRE